MTTSKLYILNMTEPQAEHIRLYRVTPRRRYISASSQGASRTRVEVCQQSEWYTPKPRSPAPDPCNIQLLSAKTLLTAMTKDMCLSVRSVKSRYGDGAGNTTEENSSVFSLIGMR